MGAAVAKSIDEVFGTDVRMVAADLGGIGDVRRVMEETDTAFGRVDILVNAASRATPRIEPGGP
jgi:short-subunit dehydrogenase